MHSFVALGWPTTQTEEGLLAPLKRRFPQDLLTFKESNFAQEAANQLVLSVAMTGRLPASRFVVYNEIQNPNNQFADFSLEQGLFIEPQKMITGCEFDDLIQDVKNSSNLDDLRKKITVKLLEKKFPEGLEAASADALRLCLLGGRQTSSISGHAEESDLVNWGRIFYFVFLSS